MVGRDAVEPPRRSRARQRIALPRTAETACALVGERLRNLREGAFPDQRISAERLRRGGGARRLPFAGARESDADRSSLLRRSEIREGEPFSNWIRARYRSVHLSAA